MNGFYQTDGLDKMSGRLIPLFYSKMERSNLNAIKEGNAVMSFHSMKHFTQISRYLSNIMPGKKTITNNNNTRTVLTVLNMDGFKLKLS